MNIDTEITQDMRDFAAATERYLPSAEHTKSALEAARRPEAGARQRKSRTRSLAAAVGVGALLGLVPFPYHHIVAWEGTFHAHDGRRVAVQLVARSEAEAERRARELAQAVGAEVKLASRSELVWATVYAMAREKLLHMELSLEGKSNEEATAEIRRQLAEQGWTAQDVSVDRQDGKVHVEFGARDEAGRHIRMKRVSEDDDGNPIVMEQEPLDMQREPGMSDEQLRNKLLDQLRARGLEGEVSVTGEQVRVLMKKHKPQ